MTTINEKMGLKRAGKRWMMNLPDTLEERARLTSARCPKCDRTGALQSKARPGWLWCSWCAHRWQASA